MTPQRHQQIKYVLDSHQLVFRVWKTADFTPDDLVVHSSRVAMSDIFRRASTSQEVSRKVKDVLLGRPAV